MAKDGKLFKDDWKARNRKNKTAVALADALNTNARIWNNFTVPEGGRIEISSQFARLFCQGSNSFAGTYYFKGVKYVLDMASSKAYWYHDASDNTAHWSDGPMPEIMPDSQFWRKTSECDPVVYILC